MCSELNKLYSEPYPAKPSQLHNSVSLSASFSTTVSSSTQSLAPSVTQQQQQLQLQQQTKDRDLPPKRPASGPRPLSASRSGTPQGGTSSSQAIAAAAAVPPLSLSRRLTQPQPQQQQQQSAQTARRKSPPRPRTSGSVTTRRMGSVTARESSDYQPTIRSSLRAAAPGESQRMAIPSVWEIIVSARQRTLPQRSINDPAMAALLAEAANRRQLTTAAQSTDSYSSLPHLAAKPATATAAASAGSAK